MALKLQRHFPVRTSLLFEVATGIVMAPISLPLDTGTAMPPMPLCQVSRMITTGDAKTSLTRCSKAATGMRRRVSVARMRESSKHLSFAPGWP